MTASIGVDYSSQVLYLACVDNSKVHSVSSIELTNTLWAFQALKTLLEHFRTSYNAENRVCIEKPWVSGMMRPKIGLMMTRSATIMELAALEAGFEPCFVLPPVWRKEVYGSAKFSDQKAQAVQYVEARFDYKLPVMGKTGRGKIPDHNFAEAVCIAAWGQLTKE